MWTWGSTSGGDRRRPSASSSGRPSAASSPAGRIEAIVSPSTRTSRSGESESAVGCSRAFRTIRPRGVTSTLLGKATRYRPESTRRPRPIARSTGRADGGRRAASAYRRPLSIIDFRRARSCSNRLMNARRNTGSMSRSAPVSANVHVKSTRVPCVDRREVGRRDEPRPRHAGHRPASTRLVGGDLGDVLRGPAHAARHRQSPRADADRRRREPSLLDRRRRPGGRLLGVGQDREHVRQRAGDDDPCVPFGHGTSLLAAQSARSAGLPRATRAANTPSAISQTDHAM